MKIIATLGALLLTGTAANALPYSGSDSFVSKSGYVVQVNHSGKTMLLSGRHPVTGVTFKLSVTPSGVATGTWNGKPFYRVVALDGRSKKPAGEQIASAR